MNRVKVGVIGCGNISAAYLKAARTFPILDIVALSDLNLAPPRRAPLNSAFPRSRSRQFWPIPRSRSS